MGLRAFIDLAIQSKARFVIEALVWSAGDVRQHVSEVVDELKVVPARIVIDNAVTYERWDRLNAEAEFREALVPPLLAIIFALAARGAMSWFVAIVLVAVPLIILFQGAAKENEARIQLIEAIDADAIKVAALEWQAIPDSHWLDMNRTAGRESVLPPATPSGARDRLRAVTARLGGRWRRIRSRPGESIPREGRSGTGREH
jgi:hypothetical protein